MREFPHTSRKTVYETRASLVHARLASCVTEGGEPFRYEPNADGRYHGRCRSCGRIFDLPAAADASIRGLTPIPDGFRVQAVHVTLLGVCRRCEPR